MIVHGVVRAPIAGTNEMANCDFMYDTEKDELIQVGGEGTIDVDDIDFLQSLSTFRDLANGMSEEPEGEPE